MASFASWSFRRMSSSLVGLNCFLLGAYDALSPVGLLVPVREIHIKQFVRHLKECNFEKNMYITYMCYVSLWAVMVVTVATGKGGRMVTLLAETVKNMCNFV